MSQSTLSRVDNLLGFFEALSFENMAIGPAVDNADIPATTSASITSTNFLDPSSMSNDKVQRIAGQLSELGIRAPFVQHDAVHTSEEHAHVVDGLNGVLVKNLFLKSKRHKTQWLVVFAADKPKIDFKALGKSLDVGGGLRMSPDAAQTTLNMSQGSISPLAVCFDENHIVEVILDQDVMNASAILVHPGTNEATIAIAPADVLRYIEACGNTAKVVDFGALDAEAAAAAKARSDKRAAGKIERKKKKGPKKAQHDDEKATAENEGITVRKEENFADWYTQVITKAQLIDYTDISGCYVLRENAYFIWERIQGFMDHRIKQLGVSNAYFPIFVSEDALRAEAKHFEDFNPEVAWVTHSGDTELLKKVAVRPTSETIMYPMFKKWIRSFRDLPLRINQWCNVVRWEFKNPTPFLRTREFLWQEGHTAHATYEAATKEVYDVLDMYADTYSEMCAIATVKGMKTAGETFPGADFTTTVESYIAGSGRGIQGATSHCLGQNFGKMFEISFLDENNKEAIPVQNSWGFTTRSIGVMIMNHSDNGGLVLPPKCAKIQAVIIPILYKGRDDERTMDKCRELDAELRAAGVRCMFDDRATKNPGWKFNEWELKGIPVRIEVGPKDMEKGTCMVARRDERDGRGRLAKVSMNWGELAQNVVGLLDEIHANLYRRAEENLHANIIRCTEWQEMLDGLADGKLVLAPHCDEPEAEDLVGVRTKEYFDELGTGLGKAKCLCKPFQSERNYQPDITDERCVVTGKPAKCWILFGRSY